VKVWFYFRQFSLENHSPSIVLSQFIGLNFESNKRRNVEREIEESVLPPLPPPQSLAGFFKEFFFENWEENIQVRAFTPFPLFLFTSITVQSAKRKKKVTTMMMKKMRKRDKAR
jgi:hypothetical protein